MQNWECPDRQEPSPVPKLKKKSLQRQEEDHLEGGGLLTEKDRQRSKGRGGGCRKENEDDPDKHRITPRGRVFG